MFPKLERSLHLNKGSFHFQFGFFLHHVLVVHDRVPI